MIRDHQDLALLALTEALGVARAMTHQRVAHAKLALVMEWTEAMARYLADPRDRTCALIATVHDLAAIDARFRPMLERFTDRATATAA